MSILGPYLMMTLLFLAMAVLMALDASLTHFALLPWFNGLRWLRVHFITLGMLTEITFGVMPLLVAAHYGRPRPALRWDIWLTLNTGLIVLVAGIPLVNGSLILTGGTLIFIAASLLAVQLWRLRGAQTETGADSLPFYVAGLSYLLLGILVGTGLWLGWSEPLRIQIPVEVHIHANNWGFMSLVFAGLLINIVPKVTRRGLGSPGSLRVLFWMMTLGALGLVIGPWLGGSLWFTVPGLILHLTATFWLLIAAARALLGSDQRRHPGAWHLITAYAWILAPVLVAPLIIFKVPGFPGAGIEATAPQALIYGWVLQFGLALLPHFARRFFLGEDAADLGGSWFSLAAVHIGSTLIWVGIFLVSAQPLLHGLGYVFYAAALLPALRQLAHIVRDGLGRLDKMHAQPVDAPR